MSNENPVKRTIWPSLDAKHDIEDIASQQLHISTLETRESDRLDFHEVSVWGVKKALLLAYEAGLKASIKRNIREVV